MAAGRTEYMGVAAALDGGQTVLTGNQRAARILGSALEPVCGPVCGEAAGTARRIFSWDAWTAGLWHRLLLDGGTEHMLLNRTQEKAIWRGLIEQDTMVSSLRSPDALAALAAEAWNLLARYRGLGRLRGSAMSADHEAFVRLADAFDEQCRAKAWLPRARLEGVLRRAVQGGTLDLASAGGLYLTGFDRITPAQQALLTAIRATGVPVGVAGTEPPAARRSRFAAPDQAVELRTAAHWIRAFLEDHPGSTVGLIVPGLGGVRAQIDRTLRAVVSPEAQSIAAPQNALAYEFSAGTPLGETPMAGMALDLLAWIAAPLPMQSLSAMLLSPYFAGGVERSARAEYDAFELRRAPLLRPEVALDGLAARLARSSRRARLAVLSGTLDAMRAVLRRRFAAGDRKAWGEWSEAMREFLGAAGWARGAAGDSIEFQTQRKWESALDELATLDFDGGRVPFDQALGMLRGIVSETTFAPESRQAPVQILQPEEAAGTRFDALWFLGADDLTWPQPVGGSPLLSWPLRRDLGLPGSESGADYAEAQRVTERLAGSAGTAVFSYPRETAEGVRRASPLLEGLNLDDLLFDAGDDAGKPEIAVEAIEDESRIPHPPDALVRGGARVLKSQAACAFHAFAEHRLYAAELDAREPGMNAQERGMAVHLVLERFWETVKTQAALRQMTAGTRESLLIVGIDEALGRARSESPTPWDDAYLETQRRRLVALGNAWLDLEAGRPLAFTVTGREMEREVPVGPLRLSLRLDRVDETVEGAVLIDYKTGPSTPSAWQGERPDEPQLPLYALFAEKLHAVAFGTVRPGKGMKLAGYAESEGTLSSAAKSKPVSLEEQREQWRGVLERLATEFWNGDTRVSPKQYPGTCTHCAHRLICRLEVASLDLDEEGEGEFMATQEDELG